ncbi:MAG TPA: LLM class flavin-dependent oxidoreductase [Steroidobacteraceae bacterium]|nr:LLM class flavin-dependent oxidoreductase [Steroidobacteraceae bacterium]
MAARFIYALPAQCPPEHPAGRFLAEMIEQVHAARAAGFVALTSPQHHLVGPLQYFQPVPLLARLATEAPGIELHTGIILLALHHPVEVAESLATLDVISGGRLVAGFGLGYREPEFSAFGVPRGERVARFEEHLKVIERLWSGEPIHVTGRFVCLDGQQIGLRPLQRPRPPIWIGANADAGVLRAARLGDAWLMNPHGALPALRRQLRLYLQARQELGRPPPERLPLAKELFVAEDRAIALRRATPYLEAKYRTYSAWGQAKTLPVDDAWPEDFTALMRDRFIIGDPDDVVTALRTYRDQLGVTDFSLRHCWPGMPQAEVLAAIDLLGRHVLPRVGLRAQGSGLR